MLFNKRRWQVADINDAAELARKLTEHSWTLCTGFRHRGFLFLNDSTCEDAPAEFCVVREADSRQVETITVGWCSAHRALSLITELTEGRLEDHGQFSVRIETPDEHGRCSLCI